MTESVDKKNKANIDLFFKDVDKNNLPKPNGRLLRQDFAHNKKIEKEISLTEKEVEKLETPLLKAKLESMRLSLEEFKEINIKTHEKKEKLIKKIGNIYKDFSAQKATDNVLGIEKDLQFFNFCKEVKVNVCKNRVCIDQPVPLTIDETWLEPGSDGELNLVREFDKFNLGDNVYG